MLVAQLMYLELEAPGEPITMYITSGGGLVYAGLAIYDTMQVCGNKLGRSEVVAILPARGAPYMLKDLF